MQQILPPSTESGAGFEPVRVRQFTVFVENKVGQLLTLVRAHEQESGKVVALAVQNEGDNALVRLIYSDPELGRSILSHEGFAFTEQDVLVVELPRATRHPLMNICSTLLTGEINILYAYPLLIRPEGPGIALYVDDLTLASQILMRKGFKIIGESDLAK